MAAYRSTPIRTLQDLQRFEAEAPLEQRLRATSVHDVFVDAAAAYPEHIALTMLMTGEAGESPRCMSYRSLLDGVTRAANLFTVLGGRDPVVAFLLPNLLETQLTLWGAEIAGQAVPLNFMMRPEALAQLVRASGARILVALGPHAGSDIWSKALAVQALLPWLVLVQVSPPDVPVVDGARGFWTVLMEQPGRQLLQGRPNGGDTVAAWFHTGGTTGEPKLVAQTHRNQLAAAFGGAVLTGLGPEDVTTNGAPLFHVGACIAGSLAPFLVGARVLMMSPEGLRNRAMIRQFWRIVERYRVTVMGAVPTALAAVLDVPVDADISSLRCGVVGAASTPVAVAERFGQVTGKPLLDVLGMTESGGLTAMLSAQAEPVIGCAGWRLPYTEVCVRRVEADGRLGPPCEPREIGMLTVRGPTISPGYRDPSRNEGVFVDGWLHTGDLACTDRLGRLYITGRLKDLIIRSGHNIDPAMIENAFLAHPAVVQAAAVGQPDRYAGEVPVCYVCLRPGTEDVDAEVLRAFVEPLIAERPAWPRHIYIVDALPLTEVGKVYKPELRCDAARRVLSELLADSLRDWQLTEQPGLQVSAGGAQGMEVTVLLRHDDPPLVQAVAAALEGFLFEYRIAVLSPD
ncbi:AMP-binding protein [Aquabacterium sp. A7-Y]|uniref:AMP-binding protein n=1 Tax=Aquabacterium sp. A7-Y TaxID=1349605 RepID=UPI00223D2B6C|nr:AMP-binding protein [Aquabacterium sp. A7-Y]MCW7537716.1 AMP-binding protein [Aquabacterium sp. A7-Y]